MSSRSPRGEGDRRALDGPDSRGPSRAPPEPSPRAAAMRRRRAHAATYARYACCMLRAAAGRCTRSHRRSRHPRTTPWSAVAAEVRARRTARSRARATEKDVASLPPPLTASSASMGPSTGRVARPTSDTPGHTIDSSGSPSPQEGGGADSSCGAPTTRGASAPAGQSAAAQSNTASHAGAALRAAAARSRWKRRRSRWTAAPAHQGLRGGGGIGFGGGCRSRHPPSPRPEEQPKQTPHGSRSGSVSAVASTAATGSAPSEEAGSVAAGAGAASTHAPPAPPLSPPLKVADAVGDAGGAPTSRSGT